LVIDRDGTAVEELKDYAMVPLPAGRVQIEHGLTGLKISGELRADTKRTVLTSQTQANAAFAQARRISWVDIYENPILLDTEGRATAVNALLRLEHG